MPHFNAQGQDLALCQLCGCDTTNPTWQKITRQDGTTFMGNVCPNCISPPAIPAHDHHDFKVTRQWIMAGNAIFTVKNAMGKHYTFKVRKVEDKAHTRPPVWFLSLLTGSDNESDSSYNYIGIVTDYPNQTLGIKTTAKSHLNSSTTPHKVATWALRRICDGAALPEGYSIDGEGRCGRCGRMLTHPDGIADDGYRLGFGPVCWALMQGGN